MFPLLRDDALPGPMSMHRLAEIGAIHQLDDDSAYLSEDAETLFGRANITNILKPFNTVSCAVSAAWVWLGGRFPTPSTSSPPRITAPRYADDGSGCSTARPRATTSPP